MKQLKFEPIIWTYMYMQTNNLLSGALNAS